MLGLLATLTEQRNALQTVNDALSTQYRTAEDQLHAALADVRTATSRCAELEDVLCTKVRWSALLGCERPSAGRGKEGGGRSASVDRLCECARACLRPYIHLPQRPPPQKVCGTSQHQEAQDSRADGGHPRERYGECRRQRAWQITAALTCLTRCRTPWTKRRPPGGGGNDGQAPFSSETMCTLSRPPPRPWIWHLPGPSRPPTTATAITKRPRPHLVAPVLPLGLLPVPLALPVEPLEPLEQLLRKLSSPSFHQRPLCRG